jgi:branched-subunit amino acid aminotransferase/4-amino-4-deoxychorismate lyase
MHNFVSLDRLRLSCSDVSIAALSSAAQLGKSIFTTIAIYDREPFLWGKHWQRLVANATALRIDITSLSEAEILDELQNVIAENRFDSGRARITIFDTQTSPYWHYASNRDTSVLITTADFRKRSQEYRLGVSPFKINSTSPLAGIKSGNYLEKVLAIQDAKAHGLQEAIQVNDRNEITSACMANIFWSKDERLFTPTISTGCLGGTTRSYVMENLECEEVESEIDALKSADEIFLTSAGIGVVQVSEFEGRKLNREPHPITDLLPVR